jgi:hypothetical protein
MVSASEADAIIAEHKVIAVNLRWSRDGRNYRLDAAVLSLESGHMLRLRGFVGRTNRSLAVLFENTPIRKYTVHDRHRDPVSREVIRQPHKHYWDDDWQDKRVYILDDIRTGDPNEELLDFLAECNIELNGRYLPGTFRELSMP